MSILNRLKKLEESALPDSVEVVEPQPCEHPPSMFKLRREHATVGYKKRRLVVAGHCNVCGFDDYLWVDYRLTEEQEERRWDMKYASDFWGGNAYTLELINAGLMDHAPYPPSPEEQIRFTGRVTI